MCVACGWVQVCDKVKAVTCRAEDGRVAALEIKSGQVLHSGLPHAVCCRMASLYLLGFLNGMSALYQSLWPISVALFLSFPLTFFHPLYVILLNGVGTPNFARMQPVCRLHLRPWTRASQADCGKVSRRWQSRGALVVVWALQTGPASPSTAGTADLPPVSAGISCDG